MTAATLQVSDWEKRQETNAHHRALILRILTEHPDGLTTQEIVEEERRVYGYTFLTDNRLRELRKLSLVEAVGEKPLHWRKKEESAG
jgi:hypothetical protein